MNLADLGTSPFLASDDYTIGHAFPLLEIASIKVDSVPTPNSTKKQDKAVMYFVGAAKGWVINKTEARKIAKELGDAKSIEKTWIGAFVALHVVGDVRRPDGTRGNAFRVKAVQKKNANQPPQEPTKALESV